VDEQMQPSIEGRDKQPTFKWSASMLSDDESDLYRVSPSVKNLYDKGYELAKKASPYGRQMMEAALYAAHMERQWIVAGDINTQINKDIYPMMDIIGRSSRIADIWRVEGFEAGISAMSYVDANGVVRLNPEKTLEYLKKASPGFQQKLDLNSGDKSRILYAVDSIVDNLGRMNESLEKSARDGAPSQIIEAVSRNNKMIKDAKQIKRNLSATWFS